MKKIIILSAVCLSFLALTKNTLAENAYLSWTASPAPDLVGYKIYYDTQSHANGICPNDYLNYANPIVTGNLTSTVLTDLEIGLTYYFQIIAFDAEGNTSECSVNPGEQSISITASSSAEADSKIADNQIVSGGGGGGTTQSISIKIASDSALSVQNGTATPMIAVSTDSIKYQTSEKSDYSAPGLAGAIDQIAIIAAEAKMIFSHNLFIALSQENKNLYSRIRSMAHGDTTDQAERSLAEFIQSGTQTTIIIGAGERAGTVGSYVSAFGRMPGSDTDWQDIIKIANGRWTSARNTESEKTAILMFKKIYRREPSRNTNKYDNNAIMIITYGLRPANRKLVNEIAAGKSFKSIFSRMPSSPNDWDIVRAIAYSGAKK